jgi:hypothetical protein
MTLRRLAVGVTMLGIVFLVQACATLQQSESMNRHARFDFEGYALGQTPADFTADLTADGGPVRWVIIEDPTAPAGAKVLAQLSEDTTSRRYPLCTFNGLEATDVEVSVRFKVITGTIDQAAGIVVRYQDKDNYYVVRANALEDNVRLYKVQDGARSRQFAEADLKITPDEWHRLTLSVRGTQFRIEFDGKILFEARDETFARAGRVGLWTKADSVTHFDDLRCEKLSTTDATKEGS